MDGALCAIFGPRPPSVLPRAAGAIFTLTDFTFVCMPTRPAGHGHPGGAPGGLGEEKAAPTWGEAGSVGPRRLLLQLSSPTTTAGSGIFSLMLLITECFRST